MRWRRRKQSERDLERELRSHLDLEAEEQLDAGLTADQARYAAQRAFGNTTLVQEEIREMSRWMLLDRLRQDLRYAFRTLGRNRGFTAVAILTLALGIGANTAIFSLLNAVELRRLPVRDPQQLVMLEWAANKKVSWPEGYSSYGGCDSGEIRDAGQMRSASAGCSFSYPVFDYFGSHSKLFRGLAAVAGPAGFQARIHGEIVRANAQFVSGDFFSVLGVSAQVGRTLDAKDDQPGAEPAAVLSSRFWQANFGGDAGIVGKTIALDGAPFTVVGVAAKEFFGLQPTGVPDLWIPVHAGARLGYGWWNSLAAGNGWLYVVGRLKPGVPSGQARAEMSVLLRQAPGSVDVFTPQIQTNMELAGIARGLSGLRRAYSDQLHVLMAVVGLVLLIACANIANLLLTRASVRRREMAVRMAIGCSRARLLQQLFTESLLLSALGTAAGLLFARWTPALAAFLASRDNHSTLIDVRLDPLVLFFTVGVACLSAALFGLAPALAGTREHPVAALKSGTASGQRSRFGRALVAAEMALALVLLIGAGLFVRTLVNLEKLDPGFRRDNLLTFQVLRPRDVNNPQVQPPANPGLRDRLAALPGVLSATWASEVLLVGNLEATTVRLAGRDDLGDVQVSSLRVGPRFFETMGIPVLAGRSVQIQDCQADATAIWINRRLAEKYGSNADPLGRVIVRGKTRYQIAGIVGDTKYETLRSAIDPSVYIPSRGGGVFVLRTASDPESLAAAARGAVRDVNSNLIVDNIKSEAAQIDEQLFKEHLMARLSMVFGLLALTMAAIGIYGVLAFSVTRRTAEIAIRMSLGAMPGGIMRLVLRDGLAPAAIGAAVGLLASWGLTKLISTLLFGVTALDPLTYIAATLLLLAVAMLACYVPARRATRVSPVLALRYE